MIVWHGLAHLHSGRLPVRLARTSFGWRCLRAGRSRRPIRPEWCGDPSEAVADYLGLATRPVLTSLSTLPLGDGALSPPSRKITPGSSAAAAKLRALMRSDPRSATDLARSVGMQPGQWRHYKTGFRCPSLDQAQRVLNALGRTFHDLADPLKPTITPAPRESEPTE